MARVGARDQGIFKRETDSMNTMQKFARLCRGPISRPSCGSNTWRHPHANIILNSTLLKEDMVQMTMELSERGEIALIARNTETDAFIS